MANGKEDKGRKGKSEPWVWDLLEWQSQERVAVTTAGAGGGGEHRQLWVQVMSCSYNKHEYVAMGLYTHVLGDSFQYTLHIRKGEEGLWN